MDGDLNPRAVVGDNRPPTPMEEALAPFSDYLDEAKGWLDGEPVQTEAQMKAVDELIKQVKAAEKAITEAEQAASKPLHDAWKAEKALWKPSLDDIGRVKKGLVKIVGDFRKKLAEKREEERRKAEAEARRREEEAKAAAKSVDAGDLEAVLKAEEELEKAKAAKAEVQDVERVKGLRKVTRYEIEDLRAALHWIARNDKAAMEDFVRGYVDRHAKPLFKQNKLIDGVRVWEDREAF